MTIIERAIHDIEAVMTEGELRDRLIAILEQACEDIEDEGYLAGTREGIQECRDNPFTE